MTYIVVVALVIALFAVYIAWLASRLTRLHNRARAAKGALDAQLYRRARAAFELVNGESEEWGSVAERVRSTAVAAMGGHDGEHEQVENDLTRAIADVPLPLAAPELAGVLLANRRIEVARQVYNDAVRDTAALRRKRLPRLLRLAAHLPAPSYFDVDTGIEPVLLRRT